MTWLESLVLGCFSFFGGTSHCITQGDRGIKYRELFLAPTKMGANTKDKNIYLSIQAANGNPFCMAHD
jgi:hypothetical protein